MNENPYICDGDVKVLHYRVNAVLSSKKNANQFHKKKVTVDANRKIALWSLRPFDGDDDETEYHEKIEPIQRVERPEVPTDANGEPLVSILFFFSGISGVLSKK